MRLREDVVRADLLIERMEREMAKTEHREEEVDAALAKLEGFAARVDRVVQALLALKASYEAGREALRPKSKSKKDKGKEEGTEASQPSA